VQTWRGLNWCFLHLPETVAGIALSRAWFLLHEKGGKRHKVPAHQNAENCVKPISTPQTSLGRRESPLRYAGGLFVFLLLDLQQRQTADIHAGRGRLAGDDDMQPCTGRSGRVFVGQ